MDVPTRRQQFGALVQAQTVVISLLPYLLGLVFTGYYYRHFNVFDAGLLLIAAVSFHFAVNGHNQYTDYRRFYRTHNERSYNNIIRKYQIPLPWARANISGLVLIPTVIGLYLTAKAGWILLLIGIISFLVGYCYSGGPYPILKTPLGEPASGITMGYNIVLLAVLINIYNAPNFDTWFWLKGLVVAAPAILVISNVMLGNNICDVDEDVKTGRHTLVYYIGRRHGLQVLVACYALAYLMIIISVLMGLLPLFTLVSLLSIMPVYQHTKLFVQAPDKASTFPNIIIDLQLILISEILFGFIGDLLAMI